jgi:hypothetical protein
MTQMKDKFFRIEVETYNGHKGAERPTAFVWKGRRIVCAEIIDRWYGENHEYFKVKGEDGHTYLLRYDRLTDQWEISQVSK